MYNEEERINIDYYDVISRFVKLMDNGSGIYTGTYCDRWEDEIEVCVDTNRNMAWFNHIKVSCDDLIDLINYIQGYNDYFEAKEVLMSIIDIKAPGH